MLIYSQCPLWQRLEVRRGGFPGGDMVARGQGGLRREFRSLPKTSETVVIIISKYMMRFQKRPIKLSFG